MGCNKAPMTKGTIMAIMKRVCIIERDDCIDAINEMLDKYGF